MATSASRCTTTICHRTFTTHRSMPNTICTSSTTAFHRTSETDTRLALGTARWPGLEAPVLLQTGAPLVALSTASMHWQAACSLQGVRWVGCT